MFFSFKHIYDISKISYNISIDFSYTFISFILDGKKDKTDKPTRQRQSRWQDPDPVDSNINNFGGDFYLNRDQDMRINRFV